MHQLDTLLHRQRWENNANLGLVPSCAQPMWTPHPVEMLHLSPAFTRPVRLDAAHLYDSFQLVCQIRTVYLSSALPDQLTVMTLAVLSSRVLMLFVLHGARGGGMGTYITLPCCVLGAVILIWSVTAARRCSALISAEGGRLGALVRSLEGRVGNCEKDCEVIHNVHVLMLKVGADQNVSTIVLHVQLSILYKSSLCSALRECKKKKVFAGPAAPLMGYIWRNISFVQQILVCFLFNFILLTVFCFNTRRQYQRVDSSRA